MTPRSILTTASLLALLATLPAPALAQDGGSFGIGPRLTFIRGAEDSTEPAQRFSGGVIRLGGGKTAIELAMDYRSGLTGDLTERIKNYPIQGSLLIYPVRARFSPYVLGGVGWYTQTVESVMPPSAPQKNTTRKMGYHAGLGGELRVHRRVGLYGDYRYTFLRFGGDETTGKPTKGADERPTAPRLIPFAERLRMTHEGSMWTWGATFYF